MLLLCFNVLHAIMLIFFRFFSIKTFISAKSKSSCYLWTWSESAEYLHLPQRDESRAWKTPSGSIKPPPPESIQLLEKELIILLVHSGSWSCYFWIGTGKGHLTRRLRFNQCCFVRAPASFLLLFAEEVPKIGPVRRSSRRWDFDVFRRRVSSVVCRKH